MDPTVSTLEEQLLERDAILDDLKGHLIQAQHKMRTLEGLKEKGSGVSDR